MASAMIRCYGCGAVTTRRGVSRGGIARIRHCPKCGSGDIHVRELKGLE